MTKFRDCGRIFFVFFLCILTSLKTTKESIHAWLAVTSSLEYCTFYYHPQCFLFILRWVPKWESSGLFLGGWTSRINGDSSKAGLAEGGSNITADLPPVNNTQCQVHLLPPHLTQALCLPFEVLQSLYFEDFIWFQSNSWETFQLLWILQCIFSDFQVYSPESINQNQAPSSPDIQNRITSTPSSVYPCTSTVNPTIVLLQHNRGEHTSPWVGDEFPKASKFIMNMFALVCVASYQTNFILAPEAWSQLCLCLWPISLIFLCVTRNQSFLIA